MGSIIDLNGGAHTITDGTETYFTFTDSVGGGTLESGCARLGCTTEFVRWRGFII